MKYQALYRKYRPFDFDDVIGQENIVKTLKNSIEHGKISHAYLFSGPRGTGKTTLAKIVAKNVNCISPENGKSCGKCQNCLSIIENDCPDIIEIDAASNNGVDEIREIRSKINLVPSQLKYKVYIIDEVHMLSIGAFNALLKTLEEPPAHIIFILATTDYHKVPVTIISRCQCFEFKRITNNFIVDRLKKICDAEKILIDDNVLDKIASISDGGMRDSLGMLDKMASYCHDKITIDEFNEVNGILNDELVEKFVEYILDSNVIEILKLSDYINEKGKDYVIFVQDIMENLRKKIILFYIDNDYQYKNVDTYIDIITKLNKLLLDIKQSANVQIMFETSILSMITKKNRQNNIIDSNDIIDTNSNRNDIINDNPIASDTKFKEISIIEVKENNKRIINNTFCTAKKEYLKDFKDKMVSFDEYSFDKQYSNVVSFFNDVVVRAVGKSEIIISSAHDATVDRGINLIDKIEKFLEKIYNIKYDIAIISDTLWEEEKNKFISNKNNGISYEYIFITDNEIENKTINEKQGNSLVNDAISLFGEDIVEIK